MLTITSSGLQQQEGRRCAGVLLLSMKKKSLTTSTLTFLSLNRTEKRWPYAKFWFTFLAKDSLLTERSSIFLNSNRSLSHTPFVGFSSHLWMKPMFSSKCTRKKRTTTTFSSKTTNGAKFLKLGNYLLLLAISPVFPEFKWLMKVWIFPIFFYAIHIILPRPKKILKTTKSEKRSTK